MSFLSIAVVGLQNAGKSSVINALIEGEYTPSSSVGCTNKVFRFPLYGSEDTTQTFESARSIHEKICAANQNQFFIDEIYSFPVRLREGDMYAEILRGFKMEIIDLPGLGNTETTATTVSSSSVGEGNTCIAMDFIKKNAGDLACILVVLDINLCDDDARQRNKCLLTRLCNALGDDESSRCIVIGNKDDQLLDESGKHAAIEYMYADVKEVLGPKASWVHISTTGILHYRYARQLDMTTFNSEYSKKLNEMGKTTYITPAKLSTLKKTGKLLATVHSYLTNQDTYDYALSEANSNFAELVKLLQAKLGTPELQRSVLALLYKKRLAALEWKPNSNNWMQQIICVSAQLKDIDYPESDWRSAVQGAFERMFKCQAANSKHNFMANADHSTFATQTHATLEDWVNRVRTERGDRNEFFSRHAHMLLDQVVEDYLKVIEFQFRDWARNAHDNGRSICVTVHATSNNTSGEKRNARDDARIWSAMTGEDWKCIIRSISVDVSKFAEYFKDHTLFFHWALECITTTTFRVALPSVYNPDMRTEPAHWGYLIWKYIDYEEQNKYQSP